MVTKEIKEMKEIKTKLVTSRLGELLYLIFFGLLLFAKGIGLYDGQTVFKVVLVAATICIMIKLAMEKYSCREIFWMALVMVLTTGSYLISGEKGMLLYGLMMIGLKQVDLKKVFTVGAVLWITGFLGTTIASIFRLEDTFFNVHAKLGLGHIFRWSLGYPHPNVLQISYFVVAVFIIYLLGDTFKVRHAFWLFAGNCIVFLYSVSYTGFAVIMCLLAGRVYLHLRKRLNLLEKILLQLIFPLCVFLSLVAPVAIRGELFNKLNMLLNTRMELAWRYLQPEYFSLFGIRVADITSEFLTMDNAYLFAYITYGLIPFAILCAGIVYMIYRYLRGGRYVESLIILSIVIGGLTEPFLFNTSFKNLSFLFMGALLFETEPRTKVQGGRNREIALFTRLDRSFHWNREPILQRIQSIRLMARRKKGLLWTCGIITAILSATLIGVLTDDPPGYVVYRSECADLTKEKHYYVENAEEYAGYKRMHDFVPGEAIEYFTGNIVAMEKGRRMIAGVLLGFAGGLLPGMIYIGFRARRQDA